MDTIEYNFALTCNTTTPNNYQIFDDYCDCDERCDKCGKKKKHFGPPYIVTCEN